MNLKNNISFISAINEFLFFDMKNYERQSPTYILIFHPLQFEGGGGRVEVMPLTNLTL